LSLTKLSCQLVGAALQGCLLLSQPTLSLACLRAGGGKTLLAGSEAAEGLSCVSIAQRQGGRQLRHAALCRLQRIGATHALLRPLSERSQAARKQRGAQRCVSR
jgi:hypothetical protein